MSTNQSDIWPNVTVNGSLTNRTYNHPKLQSPITLELVTQLSWGFLVVFVLAVVGNIIIVIVMNKPRNREIASSTFFTALAISDLIHATQVSLFKWLVGVAKINIYGSPENAFFGGIKIATNFSNQQTSTYLLVGITAERLLAITLPHKVKHLCTRFNARLWVVFIVVISFIQHLSAYFFLYDVKVFPVFRITPQVPDGDQIFHLLDLICGFLLPFVFISIGSIIIIYHIKRRVSSDAASSRANAATRNLIMANIAFIITICPFRTINVLKYFNLLEFSPQTTALTTASMVILDSNCAVNFFVYCLGSPRFREDIKELFVAKQKALQTSQAKTFEVSMALSTGKM